VKVIKHRIHCTNTCCHDTECIAYLLPMTSKTRSLRILPISGGNDERLLLRSDNTLSLLHWLICTVTISVSTSDISTTVMIPKTEITGLHFQAKISLKYHTLSLLHWLICTVTISVSTSDISTTVMIPKTEITGLHFQAKVSLKYQTLSLLHWLICIQSRYKSQHTQYGQNWGDRVVTRR